MLGVLLALLALPWQAAHADEDRLGALRTALGQDGIYLESSPALGDPDRWEQRLQEAREESSLDLPVYVALWTELPGVAPDKEFADWTWNRQRRTLGIEDDAIVVVHASGRPRVFGSLPKGPVTSRVKAVGDQADAVADEMVAAAPEQFGQITPVAWAWIFLRLSAADAPTGRELADELSGDTSLLQDSSIDVTKPGRRADGMSYSEPTVLVPGALVILGTIVVFVLMSRAPVLVTGGGQRRTPKTQPARVEDAWARGLTSLTVERELTGLSEAIAASDVRPGHSAYDRAQACADAAAHYVDSPLDRDRVGVHLLVEDGHRDLVGEPRRARCYFHPAHRAETSLRRKDVEVATCRACATAVTQGQRPDSLDVADAGGEVRPYYETADVWTATGYGALDERWASRALLAALEAR